ncbi:hypothetical protein J2Y00_003007 [Deinococcus soli (ex Cha et al. 2016)]|uniref:Uncharacterized protein n=2 Tax=Deinococcus soli (ex Cha et al. 2016) TaxID=1309411 RepID=A0AAE3XEC3_9DEIO|nr:hypothetical protein [Deinococcus soli (ex Cha et al. 2016)]MDR6327083.1 hypothetical protein [Deinococcus soli (ex Cha et al. 2016)]MDR6752451.1 hypothetical protein [Deinococcus soli (ex Cha et al. 2016)]
MFSAYFLIWIFRLLSDTAYVPDSPLLAVDDERPRL